MGLMGKRGIVVQVNRLKAIYPISQNTEQPLKAFSLSTCVVTGNV
jgi:hypothetical protein